jgi:hypothetical protein
MEPVVPFHCADVGSGQVHNEEYNAGKWSDGVNDGGEAQDYGMADLRSLDRIVPALVVPAVVIHALVVAGDGVSAAGSGAYYDVVDAVGIEGAVAVGAVELMD